MSEEYTLGRRAADKHKLYEWSVQDPDFEVTFLSQRYRERNDKDPKYLREDFCGTALLCCKWVEEGSGRKAMGLDLDKPTLEWASQNNLADLGRNEQKRVQLLQQDVRTVTKPLADVVFAGNFSYCVFWTLPDLIAYFKKVYKSIAPGGIFVLDCYGGPGSQEVSEEEREVESPDGASFGYIWEQADFDPVNNRTQCHIHFEFKGGLKMNRAFTYDWRLYSPAEIQDALSLAGFENVEVYWDGEDDPDESDYQAVDRADASFENWIVYIVGEKPVEKIKTKPRF